MRNIAIVTGALALAVIGGVAGCRDEIPKSDVELFIERYRDLPREVQIDSLRPLLDDPGPTGTYASFQLGNVFYADAVDTADVRGWNHTGAQAQLDSAQHYFERAVDRDSTFIAALVNLGSLWDDRSNILSATTPRGDAYVQAEKYYDRALAIDPDDEKARCNLGSLYLRQRRTQDAKDQFQYVLERNPKSALAHYNMAIMFAEARIYREAVREWELAAKHDPDGDIGERSRDNIEIIKQLQEQDTAAAGSP
jgi:tetratricopeptide (TPR) repeat protein